jgi:beta-lactamase class A
LILLILSFAVSASHAQVVDPGGAAGTASLKERINKAVAIIPSGEVYVGAKDLLTGETAYYRGDVPCQWASTVKLAVLYTLYSQAEKGALKLSARHTLKPEDYRLFSPVFLAFDPGLNPTLRDCAYWMIAKSDNTASDILINRLTLGQINATLKERGFPGFHVEKTLQDLLSCFVGISPAEMSRKDPGTLREMMNANVRKYDSYADLERKTGVLAYNVCTAADMLRLMQLVMDPAGYRSGDTYEEVKAILLEGGRAFTDRLPPGARAYGKSGSLLSSVSQASVIHLADGRKFAVVIAINASDEPASKLSPRLLQMLRVIAGHEGGEE